ncbi:MAG: SRPBCC family protein [Nocardioidaceae bacterium]
MTTTSRTFSVTPPPRVVLTYLQDFAHAEQWDPGTVSCQQIGDGPVEVGTRWNNVSKIAGNETELVYTLKELTDDTIVLEGKNEQATSLDTITVLPQGSGSEVTYTAELEMHGAAKLLTPVMKVVFEKLGNDTEDDMVEVLNGLG